MNLFSVFVVLYPQKSEIMRKEHLIIKIFALALFLFNFQTIKAQDHLENHEVDDSDHNHEHSHKHEFGVSVSPVYFIKEKELSTAVHLHYTHNVAESRFGVGLAYEHIFDEHKHNFFGIEGSFRPVHPWSLSVTPGITYEGKDFDEKQFALHFETAYEFEISHFHLGPAFEFAYHSEDFHLSLGVHIGFGL